MRSPLLLFALFATVAAAQPADRVGVYGVVGSAAPERSLFPDAADPALVVGARLAPGLDAHLGVRAGTSTSLFATRPGAPVPAPGDVVRRETVDQTRAFALGLRARTETAALRLSASASVALDALDKTVTTFRAPADADPEGAVREAATGSAVFTHAGLSATVAVPLAGGRIAPGVGVAGSFSSTDGGLDAPPARWMPFLSLPSTVTVGAADVTLDARVGIARGAGSRSAALERAWAPVVEAGLRVDL